MLNMGNTTYFVGLDDTDNYESIGTGAFARELVGYLERHLGANSQGITRHQFLIHPDIPYTTHNSSACIEIECDSSVDELTSACRTFIGFLTHPGADPGLCIAKRSNQNASSLAFARRAQTEVVTKAEALELGAGAGVLLEEHGGDGGGVIGALCGCALRMDGNDGRFIAHRGIRKVKNRLTVNAIINETAVEGVVDESGAVVDKTATVVTNDWLRPDLRDGKIVMPVRLDYQTGDYVVEKKKKGRPTS
jgi:hypothetical protein